MQKKLETPGAIEIECMENGKERMESQVCAMCVCMDGPIAQPHNEINRRELICEDK